MLCRRSIHVGDDGGNSTAETDENTASPINYSDYVRKHGIDTKQGQGAEAVCLMQKDMDNDGTLCLAGASWLARTFSWSHQEEGKGRGRGRMLHAGEKGGCAEVQGHVALHNPSITLCLCLRIVGNVWVRSDQDRAAAAGRGHGVQAAEGPLR